MARTHGDADANANLDLPFLPNKSRAQKLDDRIRYAGSFQRICAFRQDRRELVATEPSRSTLASDNTLKSVGNTFKQKIACLVAQRVVDLLEAIEVQHKDSSRVLLDKLVQLGQKGIAVR